VRLPGNSDRVAAISGAVERRRALRITYYTATRDETSERVVDPMRVLVMSGHEYLEAWCRRAEAVRMFRVDRIDAMTELTEPSAPPPQAHPADLREGVFQPGPDLPLITVRVGRPARWITEYYPCERVTRGSGEEWLVSLRVSDLGWARRFVLGLGPDALAIAPPELVAAVRDQATTALQAYAVPGV
jgi:proteasome accessory factor C